MTVVEMNPVVVYISLTIPKGWTNPTNIPVPGATPLNMAENVLVIRQG